MADGFVMGAAPRNDGSDLRLDFTPKGPSRQASPAMELKINLANVSPCLPLLPEQGTAYCGEMGQLDAIHVTAMSTATTADGSRPIRWQHGSEALAVQAWLKTG